MSRGIELKCVNGGIRNWEERKERLKKEHDASDSLINILEGIPEFGEFFTTIVLGDMKQL